MTIELFEKYKGCIIGGAIGDAWGSSYENINAENNTTTYYLGKKPETNHEWRITDDTILNLATCEALQEKFVTPEFLSQKFVEYFKRNEIVGVGASTLKALQDLSNGFHWTQSGRRGEFGAGNGSAMRIAPFAFFDNYTRENIYNFSKITHNNDEAYVGTLTIYLIIRYIVQTENVQWNEILDEVIAELPDTNLRDRLLEFRNDYTVRTIKEFAELGTNGYVVNSIPFAIFSATKLNELGFENVINEIINCGGDTDTNASIAGQIMGTILGFKNIPLGLVDKLKETNGYKKIEKIIAG